MMSFRVDDKIDSRRGDDVEPVATRRVVERDRTVVSGVRVLTGWWTSDKGEPHRVDGRVVRAEDGHRLEIPSHRALRCVVQDVHATNRRMDGGRHLATDPRVVPGQA